MAFSLILAIEGHLHGRVILPLHITGQCLQFHSGIPAANDAKAKVGVPGVVPSEFVGLVHFKEVCFHILQRLEVVDALVSFHGGFDVVDAAISGAIDAEGMGVATLIGIIAFTHKAVDHGFSH